MNQKDAEILGKIMEIARLKKEIVQAIVPEKTYKHLEVIGNEFKAMVIDLIGEVACDCDCKCKTDDCNAADCKPPESDGTSKGQASKIKKVDID
jgi:hypothetical protein